MSTVEERFAKFVMPEPNTGCHLWMGATTRTGYGLFRGGRFRLAHRFSWTLSRGAIPDGLVLDHLCRVRCCVNPDHLRLATHAVNALENSIGASAINAQKAVCPRCAGPYSVVRNGVKKGSRFCKTCINERVARYRRKIGLPVRVIGPRSRKWQEEVFQGALDR